MAYKTFADLAGLAAYYLHKPVLVVHGLACLYVLVRDRKWYVDLRNVVDDGSRGRWAVWLCLLPVVYYYLDGLHLGAYVQYSFTSRAYFVHHVFGVNALLFGFQARLANYTSLLMQTTHGALIVSFSFPAEISVLACTLYYYSSVTMLIHHIWAVWRLEGGRVKTACTGFVCSIWIMGMLRDQQDVFSSCENPPSTPIYIFVSQCITGVLLSALALLPPLYHTFLCSPKQL